MDTYKITRVEVIDHTLNAEYGGGRVFVGLDNKVEVQLQDDGRTLKVFIS